MSKYEMPDRWAERIVKRGYTRRDGGPNITTMARAAKVSVETARRMVLGIGTPDPLTVAAVSAVLGKDVEGWLGREVHGEWTPHPNSALLTQRQKKALDELILAMTERQDPRPRNATAHESTAADDARAHLRGNATRRALEADVRANRPVQPETQPRERRHARDPHG